LDLRQKLNAPAVTEDKVLGLDVKCFLVSSMALAPIARIMAIAEDATFVGQPF
jgi:hypothetical protein